AKPVHQRLDRGLRRLAIASVKLVPRTLKRDVIQEQPAETLEPVILRPRRSIAVRLTASVLEGIAVHGQAPQNAISSKSSARDALLAGGLSCFGLMLSERYLRPLFEVRIQPESQNSVPSTLSVPL